ncbi:tetratricopeptide repeat protein [Thiotrichales bacterium 19S3-7]|nr:tetratricopeptide repeat protein [Thiotrichales bacterium 19S3-7]MCF6800775.1 tetratricopeptide repeat protein [Thiotrichales bacterium 19S3-11]
MKQKKTQLVARVTRGKTDSVLAYCLGGLCLFICIIIFMFSARSADAKAIPDDQKSYKYIHFLELMLAEISLNRHYWPEAVALYLRLADETDDDIIKANAMELSFALGLKEKAKPIIIQWNQEKPTSVLAKIYLAKLYLFEKKYLEAENLLYQIDISDQSQEQLKYEVIFLKGLLAFDLRLNHKAMTYFKQLITHSEYKNNAAIFIAKLYLMDAKIDEAIIYYKKVKDGALFYNAQLALMMLYVHIKNPQQALLIVSNILPYVDNQPYRKRFLYIKGTLELVLSRHELAILTFEEGINAFPTNANFYYLRGLSYLRVGNYKQAQLDMQSTLELEPDHPEALSALGFILAEDTDYDRSYEILKKAQKLAPKTPQVLDSLGWLMYKQGNHKQALIYLEEAYDLLPYGVVAYHYAGVLEANGQKEKAQVVVEKIQDDKENGYDIQQLIQHYRGKWND